MNHAVRETSQGQSLKEAVQREREDVFAVFFLSCDGCSVGVQTPRVKEGKNTAERVTENTRTIDGTELLIQA